MNWTLTLDPLLPIAWVAGLGLVAVVAGVAALRKRAVLRLIAVAALTLALLNPALVREQRDPLPDTVVLVTDESESMTIGDRQAAREAAADEIRRLVANDGGLEIIEVRAGRDDDGTRLFDALARAVGEAPRDRLAGVIAITDGQVHDAPETANALGIDAPVHALLVGDRRAGDRRLEVLQAPQFGIVGEKATFNVRIVDAGAAPGERALVRLWVDGGDPVSATAPIGEAVEVEVAITKRGANVVEIEAAPGTSELTLVNNRAAVSVSGVRDRLRVLLITGEPHAGARAWRDLLKSDPSVDLVHFTILRPPEKGDAAPIEELSLIGFPTDELFQDKLEEFDLVIFDRYKRRGVIFMSYLDNIARYVEGGGALLIAAGPDFATPLSLYRTPLSAVLPARPSNAVAEGGFRPALTDMGRTHPVTSEFARTGEDQTWGRWFRVIEATPVSGQPLLTAGDSEDPLLMLDRVGDGRVALVLSDQPWLWARGVEGGGPHAELFRRLAHWMMKEPELEEERLAATVADGDVQVSRRTMGGAPGRATVTTPSGQEIEIPLAEVEPGLYAGAAPIAETGLHRVRSGDLTTVASAGPLNPKEFADLTPTDAALNPLIQATGGGAFYLGDGAGVRAPTVRRTRADADQAGRGWMGLQRNNAYVTRSQDRRPLAPALLAVLIALGALTGAWAREGR